MLRTLLSLGLAVLTLSAVPSAAQTARPGAEKAPPEGVARFLVGTRLGYITCRGEARTYLEKADLHMLVTQGRPSDRMEAPSDEVARTCVHDTLAKGRGLYEEATRQAAAPAARTALKEYMTAWEASLGALQAGKAEAPRDFEARHRKQEARLDELQARVESTSR